ncbi:rhodopsin-like orphan GPCR [Gloeocapsa sp. PCC 7428]|nr:rhodopsin-like orphan GPCR [Gloeocapsa sp. PCC 7428]
MKQQDQNIKNTDTYNTFERIFYLFVLICISLLGLIVVLPLFLIKQVINISKFILNHDQSNNDTPPQD